LQLVLGIISVIFSILGIGLIHLETVEIKKHGFSLASFGFILFGTLWVGGWVTMAVNYFFD